ncbi:telomere-protecting terminal protein Tpg, partial [Streptomyces sp. NPDC058394]|uniref:telomere-protecting terminal protein Tpg n=1 Tax=Streptomyces sp. NPDC058394 TaxID=3346477 RepID=UPI003667B077
PGARAGEEAGRDVDRHCDRDPGPVRFHRRARHHGRRADPAHHPAPAPPGTTDDGRIRRITQHLPPQYAARLFDAQAAGASEQQLQNIAAEGLQEQYFKDGGRRADGLVVEFTDIDYIELDYS